MLSAQSQQMYGTVSEEAREETRGNSKLAVVLTAAALLAVGVVAMTMGTRSAMMASSVNTEKFTSAYGNTNKASLAKVSPLVAEVGLKVLNITVYNQRWAIFGFDRAQDEIVPLMTGQATFNWRKDFKLFRNALPEEQAVLAVYNFQYWVSETEVESDPIMITWCPPGLEPEKLANAGYFLGAEILALNTEDEGRLKTDTIITGNGKHYGPLQRQNQDDRIGVPKGQGFADPPERQGFSGPYRMESISEDYETFCENEMMVPAEFCALDNSFHECPFDKLDSEKCQNDSEKCGLVDLASGESLSPCDQSAVCGGAEFGKPAGERPEIPAACCEYINKEFCAVQRASDGLQGAGFGRPGCHHVTLTAINALCEGAEPSDAVHFGDHAYESFDNCDDKCRASCVFFDDPTDTYKYCDGCPVDGDYQCHPGDEANSIQPAYGYMTGMCCGFNPKCGAKDGDGKPVFADHGSCNTQEYNGCIWMEQTHCLEEQHRQEIEQSSKGCCVLKNAEDELGTTWQYIDSREVFCGKVDTPHHQEWNVAVDEAGNPVDPSLIVFHAANADLDQTGGNVCHLLQEEAATKQANRDEHDRVAALPTTPAPEAAERRV